MKKIAGALLLLILVFSCQKESIQNEEEQAIDNTKTEITPKSFGTTANDYTQREILEINLKWTSYITGSVLRNDPASRLEVAALLQNGNNVIKLHQLFGNNSAFENKFQEFTDWYLFMGYPNHDKTRPNPPPQGIGGGHSNLTAAFMNYILNEHCIELYFPKSMVFVGEFNITTTGHPMNATDDSNDGIIRYFSPLTVNTNGTLLYSTTHEVTVNDAYVQNRDNIIIARPYKNLNSPIGGTDCSYTQYSDIADFTDFLDY
ncbi:hypothetical protein [uncultured Kordia sp.]|uniref:hypothetical protein n=1 Tax=uncultured Kordia sp. TaxID=507699 RepID=UPI00261AA606|nr:hypothetical protein [uncultured Kordia sp.]